MKPVRGPAECGAGRERTGAARGGDGRSRDVDRAGEAMRSRAFPARRL